MGIGAVPDVMLARSAGLELGETGGIACSPIARDVGGGRLGGGRRVRVRLGGPRPPAAGRALGGRARPGRGGRAARSSASGEPYDEVPYFWSDLSDWCTLEYVGPAAEWDREVVRGSIDDGEFTIFYLPGETGRRRRSPSAGRTTSTAPAS